MHDIEKWPLCKLGLIIRYGIENDKKKMEVFNAKRNLLITDIRVAYHADPKEFLKYCNTLNGHTGHEKGVQGSKAAANDLIARGIIDGHKRKSRQDNTGSRK